jgi:2,5-furandicarboxylate decarboxylase 1
VTDNRRSEDFRDMLARMEREGHLRRVAKTISPRHITALCGKASSALLCEAVDDYDIPVVGGLYWTRARTASALGWPEGELGARFAACAARPIAPELVNDAPCQEVVVTGDDVDLTMLPIPFMHEKDGGPYISAGVAFANDEQLGPNAGCYRLMFRTRREMAIDLFTASDLRRYYSTAYARNAPLPVAIAIGVHVFEHMAAAYKAPAGLNEMDIAGGLHGAPVHLVRGKTVDVAVPARAEIVLEGELLPTGWTNDEGPFGEFAGMQGDLKKNPLFRVTAITHRRNPIFYALQMPWENDWLNGPGGNPGCRGARHRRRMLRMVGGRFH